MPPKKGKSSRSEESVASNAQDNPQLTGYFPNDFPIYCTQNGLPPIAVRNIDEPDASNGVTGDYWVWYKPDSNTVMSAGSSDDANNAKKLLKFSLRNLKITGPFMVVLQSSFQGMSIAELSLWRTDIDVNNLSLLVDLIPIVQCKALDIGGSHLTDLNPIKKALTNQDYTNLVSLTLRSCEMTDDVLTPIIEALKDNVLLQQLDLSHNSLSDEGMKLLSGALRMNRNLLSLVLLGNGITDIGVLYIAQILKEFILNHEEIVKRRKVYSICYEDQWTSLNDPLSRRCSSRKSVSKEKSPGLDASSRKPTAGALMKAASFIAKTKKGMEQKKKPSVTGKGSASDDKTTPTTPAHSAAKAAVQQGPFVEGIKINDDKEIVCIGNYSLINLSLSYNQIGTLGVDLLLSVLQYQKLNSSEHGIGLQNISLQGNQFSSSYENHIELQDILTNKLTLPLTSCTPTNLTTAEELPPKIQQ